MIFHSPLGRASKTAKIISSNLKYRTKLVSSSALLEVDYGFLSGKSKYETAKKFPLYHKSVSFVNPRGESFLDMEKRILKFIKNLDPAFSKVLLVTHAGCIRAIYSFFKGESLQKNINMKVTNTTILKCVLSKEKKAVDTVQK